MNTTVFCRQTDIQTLSESVNLNHESIIQTYKASLLHKQLPENLKVDVKNQLENLRSMLEYCAHDIGLYSEHKKGDTYFPHLKDLKTFEDRINGWFPALKTKNPNLYGYLENLQPYHAQNKWLNHLITIANDFKHVRLVPQVRVDVPALSISNASSSIALSGTASISLDGNASILLNGAMIAGGQTIDVNSSMIIGDPALTVKKEVWVDFLFDGQISALWLLDMAKTEVPLIIKNIYLMMS